ncbi:hypothetical protein [Streptomyces sp. JHA26]|uniref:hypothetical protein n=1 Tax=Streptomyces sp. JHA26 TaxID=1917143 RepID=UPI000D1A35CA|nr:hypothetical protein [Streptomyces sp. JHA26]
MSDVTRRPGGDPVERDAQTPDARGGTAPGTSPTGGTGTYDGTAPYGTGTHADHGTGPTGGAGPAPGTYTDHGAGTRDDVTPGPRTDAAGGAAGAHGLLPHEECDRLGQRLQHAVAEFVDAPRASVEEADRVLEELAARFADAVAHRRRTLRTAWQDTGGETRATSTDTEQLRLALRDYRELADRLMHV